MEHGKTPGYIDLSKAFDTLSFNIILYKLNYYGIAGTEIQLLTIITYKTGNSMSFLIIMNLSLLRLQQVSHKDPFWTLCCSV